MRKPLILTFLKHTPEDFLFFSYMANITKLTQVTHFHRSTRRKTQQRTQLIKILLQKLKGLPCTCPVLNFTENKNPVSEGRPPVSAELGRAARTPGLTCSSRGHSAQLPRSRSCAGALRPGRLFSKTKEGMRPSLHSRRSRFQDTWNVTWFPSDTHLHFQTKPIHYCVSDLAVSALKLSFSSFIVSIKKKISPSIYNSTSVALGRTEHLSQPLHGLDLLTPTPGSLL